MEAEKPILQGFLLVPPQGMLGQLKRTWQKKYCQLFKSSNHGVKRLEIWDNKDDIFIQLTSPKIITLEDCIKISPYNQPKVFTIFTKASAYYFGSLTEADTCEWINVIQQVAFNDDYNNKKIIEEENELYCASGDDVFSVLLIETAASKRCRLLPKHYILVISEINMILKDDDDTILYTWPYRYIRKYGYRDGTFTFEAGRKCQSGEGLFKLEHNNQQEIFKCISAKMKSMKKLLKNYDGKSLLVNDYLQVPHNLSQFSQLSEICALSISNTSTNQNSHQLQGDKSVPLKPPRRKHFPHILSTQSSSNTSDGSVASSFSRKIDYPFSNLRDYEASGEFNDERHSYDFIEIRNNAWKTYGIDTVPNDDDVIYEDNSERYPNKFLNNSESNNNSKKNIGNDIYNSIHKKFSDYHQINRENLEAEPNNDFSDSIYNNSNRNNNINNNANNSINNNNNEVSKNDTGVDIDLSNNFKLMLKDQNNEGQTQARNISPTSVVYNNLSLKTELGTNYDQLEHIGPSHKFNNSGNNLASNVISNVSQDSIRASSSSSSTIIGKEVQPEWNDYDIVERSSEGLLQSESKSIYGVIKKINHAFEPQYELFNNSEYAIVSKPKHV